MSPPLLTFKRVEYARLNPRQKEIFNFQKVSGVLAEYGYATLRLSDDWNGADFLAVHVDGSTTLRVQLKARLTFDKKYVGRDIWICFRYRGLVYLYLHDGLLKKALPRIEKSESWKAGTYSYSSLPLWAKAEPNFHCLGKEGDAT